MLGSKVKSIAIALLMGVGMVTSGVQAASADLTNTDWYVVRLKNPTTFLNCRQAPSIKSKVVSTFKEGTGLELGPKQGRFYPVGRTTSTQGGCFVSQDFVRPLDTAKVKGIIYKGPYEVKATDVNKRTYASIKAPTVGKRLQRGEKVTVVGIAFDTNNQSWLQLATGEFAVGESKYYTWKGGVADPNIECNYLRQLCQ